MRLGSAKDVKTLFPHFVAALAFRCILLIQDAARQCPFLHCRAFARAFLSLMLVRRNILRLYFCLMEFIVNGMCAGITLPVNG